MIRYPLGIGPGEFCVPLELSVITEFSFLSHQMRRPRFLLPCLIFLCRPLPVVIIQPSDCDGSHIYSTDQIERIGQAGYNPDIMDINGQERVYILENKNKKIKIKLII